MRTVNVDELNKLVKLMLSSITGMSLIDELTNSAVKTNSALLKYFGH